MLNSQCHVLVLGVIDPVLGSVECRRKQCSEPIFIHVSVQLQQHCEGCSPKNGVGGIQKNVIAADTPNIGRPKSIRSQKPFQRKVRELNDFRSLVLGDDNLS